MTNRTLARLAIALPLAAGACHEKPVSRGQDSRSSAEPAAKSDAPSVPSTRNAERRAALTKDFVAGEAYRIGPEGSATQTGYRKVDLGRETVLVRTEQRACPQAVLAEPAPSAKGECSSHVDCNKKAYGMCHEERRSDGALERPPYRYVCSYGCAEDGDCAENEVCVCGPETGTCVANLCDAEGSHGDALCAACDYYPRQPFQCLTAQSAKKACDLPTY